MCLPDVTSKLQRQHEQLQGKLQQLTATLTESKQANACMGVRVDAATADTKTQLQAATVSGWDLRGRAHVARMGCTLRTARNATCHAKGSTANTE